MCCFEVSQIFKKHFLTSRYEYSPLSEVMMYRLTSFPYHFVHRNEKKKNHDFSYENVRLALIPL